MGNWPWASVVGAEILIIGLVFAAIGACVASLVWWLV